MDYIKCVGLSNGGGAGRQTDCPTAQKYSTNFNAILLHTPQSTPGLFCSFQNSNRITDVNSEILGVPSLQ
jgi:hypothetical protein